MTALKYWIATTAVASTLLSCASVAAPQHLMSIFNNIEANGVLATTAPVSLTSLVLDQDRLLY